MTDNQATDDDDRDDKEQFPTREQEREEARQRRVDFDREGGEYPHN